MTWEEHRQLGWMLKDLEARGRESQPGDRDSPYWRIKPILMEMRHELDKHLFRDCPEHSNDERTNIYYGSFDPGEGEKGDTYAALKDALEKIKATNPKSKAIKHVNGLLDESRVFLV